MKWKCISGGLKLNGKPVRFGSVIESTKNPAEGYFVETTEDSAPTMKMPKSKKVKS